MGNALPPCPVGSSSFRTEPFRAAGTVPGYLAPGMAYCSRKRMVFGSSSCNRRRALLKRRRRRPVRETLPLRPVGSSSLLSLCAITEAHRPPCQTRAETPAARVVRRRSRCPSAALHSCDCAPARRYFATRASDADDSMCLIIVVTA